MPNAIAISVYMSHPEWVAVRGRQRREAKVVITSITLDGADRSRYVILRSGPGPPFFYSPSHRHKLSMRVPSFPDEAVAKPEDQFGFCRYVMQLLAFRTESLTHAEWRNVK